MKPKNHIPNCLIIDDDPLICDLVKHFCSKLGWEESCWSVENGNQAIHALSSQQFDLVFLDYNLPDLNGKEILSFIPQDTAVIMITTEQAFGAESYEFAQIVDFLVKPISSERFMKSIMKYNGQKQKTDAPASNKKQLIVKDGNIAVIIKKEDIKYIKSESNYVQFYTHSKKVMSLMSLKQLENELSNNFIRIHKSYIINLNFLDAISTDEVRIGETAIPIGAKYKALLNNKLNKLF